MKLFFAGNFQDKSEQELLAKVKYRLFSFWDFYTQKSRDLDKLIPQNLPCPKCSSEFPQTTPEECDYCFGATQFSGTQAGLYLDSGAYSFITGLAPPELFDDYLKAYVSYLKKNRHRYMEYVELDIPHVIGEEKYIAALKYFRENNLTPMRVWHPSTPESFEELCANNDIVGLSYKDIKSPTWLEQRLLVANDLGCKIHLFGYTNPSALMSMKNIPAAYSCDSTSWTSGIQYGRVYEYIKSTNDLRQLPMEGIHHLHHSEIFTMSLQTWTQFAEALENKEILASTQQRLIEMAKPARVARKPRFQRVPPPHKQADLLSALASADNQAQPLPDPQDSTPPPIQPTPEIIPPPPDDWEGDIDYIGELLDEELSWVPEIEECELQEEELSGPINPDWVIPDNGEETTYLGQDDEEILEDVVEDSVPELKPGTLDLIAKYQDLPKEEGQCRTCRGTKEIVNDRGPGDARGEIVPCPDCHTPAKTEQKQEKQKERKQAVLEF